MGGASRTLCALFFTLALLTRSVSSEACSVLTGHLSIKPWRANINCVVRFDYPVYMSIFDFSIGSESYITFFNQHYNAANPPLFSQFFLPSGTGISIYSPEAFTDPDGLSLSGLLFLFTEALTTAAPSPLTTFGPSTSLPSACPSSTSPSFSPTSPSFHPSQSPSADSPTLTPSSEMPSPTPSSSFPTRRPVTGLPSVSLSSNLPTRHPFAELSSFSPSTNSPTLCPSTKPTTIQSLSSSTSSPTLQPSISRESSKQPSTTSIRPSQTPTTITWDPTTEPSHSPHDYLETSHTPSKASSSVSPSSFPSEAPSNEVVVVTFNRSSQPSSASESKSSFLEEVLIGSSATIVMAVCFLIVVYRKFIRARDSPKCGITIEAKLGKAFSSDDSDESETSQIDMGFGFPRKEPSCEKADESPALSDFCGGNFLEAQIFNHRIGELSHCELSDDEFIISEQFASEILFPPSRESTPGVSYPVLAPLRYELDLVSEVDTASTTSDVTVVSQPESIQSVRSNERHFSSRSASRQFLKRFPAKKTRRICATAGLGDDVHGEVPVRKPRRRVVRRPRREDDNIYICE